jgi:ADP-heptose:LPS heptosyltransferase
VRADRLDTLARSAVGPLGAPLPDVGRIAVLRCGGLGDLVFALPAIQSLADAYPAAEITLLGTPGHARLLAGRPGPVSQVIALAAPPGPGVRGAPPPGAPVDLAVQLHGGGRWSNTFLLDLGARCTVGARTPDAAELDRCLPYRYYQHEVLRALEIVGLAGAPPTAFEPHLATTGRDRDEGGAALAGLPTPVVAVHPGASDARRRWPAHRFAAVAAALVRQGCGVVVLGSRAETATVDEVTEGARQLASRPGAVRPLAGSLTLDGLVGVLAGCAVLVGNDSGPRHLAQAVGTPTVGVFWIGNVINAGPFGRTRHRVHPSWTSRCPVCGLDCTSPHGRRCDHDVSFVSDVRTQDVLSDVLELLAAR